MTENNETFGSRPVDVLDLCLALVGGPVLVTAAFFWVYFIPVVALFLGGPVWLLVGSPVLFWYLRRFPPGVVGIAILALVTVLALAALLALASLALGNQELMSWAIVYATFGAVFALAWGLAAGGLYVWLSRDDGGNGAPE